MSEFWINFLLIPSSNYLKEMRKLLIVMQKSEVIYRVSKCKILWKDLIRGHDNKMGAKDDGKVKTYKILIYVSVNLKKVRNLWVNM